MDVFIIWVIVTVLLVSGYLYYLIRRSPKGFRLQVKLTLTFFLMVLIPTVPLTFIVSALLTQGIEMFLLPGVEQSLTSSLRIIKAQIEDKGQLFIKHHPDDSKIDSIELKKYDLLYVSKFRIDQGASFALNEITSDPKVRPKFTPEVIAQIVKGEITNKVLPYGDHKVCETYHLSTDSILTIMGIMISNEIINAKDDIAESLRVYTSLTLLKKSVLEERIIWGVATVFVILLLLIAIYAARFLSRSVSDPIQQLALGMQQVASGDLSSKVLVDARNEIKILVDTFNKMAEDLRVSQQNLVRAERIAAWRDLARRISHEIKNTLTPIQISLHRLKKSLTLNNIHLVQEPILTIEDEIESLRRIAEEFSQFARMPQIKRDDEDLNLIIQALVPLIEGGPKPINIVQELDYTIPKLKIDRDQFKRALHNLLKNSVEASAIGSTILIKTIALDNGDKKAKIIIKDEGHGISDELIDKIFEPYVTTKQRGMGLGLSIVKRIVEDHDGEIKIESQQGKGTTVTIII